MTDHLLAYAAHLDREPTCTCVSTDRGTDTLGCPTHDDQAAGLGGVSRETASMRRAKRWLAEMQADAGVSGRKLDGRTADLFRHMTTCAACNLREHNDPEFCDVAEAIQDGEGD